MTIETNITNRRELASALAQYMNTRAVYLGPPTFAYQIGDIHLSREGILSGNDLDGMSMAGSNQPAILYGDFSQYVIGDREHRSVKRLGEVYARQGQVAYLISQRVDAVLMDKQAIAGLKMS